MRSAPPPPRSESLPLPPTTRFTSAMLHPPIRLCLPRHLNGNLDRKKAEIRRGGPQCRPPAIDAVFPCFLETSETMPRVLLRVDHPGQPDQLSAGTLE